MPLAMSRPWKHPKTGIYQLRKVVPDDLRKLVGKREEKVSLQTRDPGEAKVRHAKALAELEARWANLRAGPKLLTEREAHQLAAVSHERWLEQYRDNPSQQTSWDTELGDRLFGPPPAREEKDAARAQSVDVFSPEPELYKIARMEQACLEAADGFLSAHGFSEDWQNRRTMARAIGAAIQRASLVLAKLAKGETVPEFPFPNLSVSPGASVARSPGRAVTFQDLLDGWAAERRPVAKTVYEWSRVIRELEKYLGHTDAHRLTAENLVDWKRALVAAGLRAKTIQGSKLSPVRAILQWGLQNKLLICRRVLYSFLSRSTVDTRSRNTSFIARDTTQRFSTPSHRVQCLLFTLRMLVVPPSGSIRSSSLKSTGLPLASNFLARASSSPPSALAATTAFPSARSQVRGPRRRSGRSAPCSPETHPASARDCRRSG
ncbi:hypothetical protein ACVWWO_004702 [Bradyrhizobium sp. F1.13.1]